MFPDLRNTNLKTRTLVKRNLVYTTVAHLEDEKNEYLYHISDNRKHNHKFTSAVVINLVEYYRDVEMYRFKTDNCSEQYKCCNVFPLYQNLAMSTKKTIITYYGVKGHGKGLVDAMKGDSDRKRVL